MRKNNINLNIRLDRETMNHLEWLCGGCVDEFPDNFPSFWRCTKSWYIRQFINQEYDQLRHIILESRKEV